MSAILGPIFTLANLIKEQVNKLKSNERLGGLLSERIDKIIAVLEESCRTSTTSIVETCVSALESHMKELMEALEEYNSRGTIRRFTGAGDMAEKIRGGNQYITDLIADLTLAHLQEESRIQARAELDKEAKEEAANAAAEDGDRLMQVLLQQQDLCRLQNQQASEEIVGLIKQLEAKTTNSPMKPARLPKSATVSSSRLRLLKKIGSGGFGEVWLALLDDATNVAVKKMVGGGTLSSRQQNVVSQEVGVMYPLRHPNIVSCFGICLSNDLTGIVMEFVDGGSLYDALWVSSAASFPDDATDDVEANDEGKDVFLCFNARVRIAIGVASGLEYLHESRVVHGDVKSMNVLLTKSAELPQPKLIDFGLSRIKQTTGASLSHKSAAKVSAGSVPWMAPELLCGARASYASDVWAFGMLLYELLTGKIPFEEVSPGALQGLIEKGVTPDYTEEKLDPSFAFGNSDPTTTTTTSKESILIMVMLMKDCWHKDPADRPLIGYARHLIATIIASSEGSPHQLSPSTAVSPLRSKLPVARASDVSSPKTASHKEQLLGSKGGEGDTLVDIFAELDELLEVDVHDQNALVIREVRGAVDELINDARRKHGVRTSKLIKYVSFLGDLDHKLSEDSSWRNSLNEPSSAGKQEPTNDAPLQAERPFPSQVVVSDDSSAATTKAVDPTASTTTSKQSPGSLKDDELREALLSRDVEDLFKHITNFKPSVKELPTKLRPFIPDYIPCCADFRALSTFCQIPRPDGRPDNLGLVVLDEQNHGEFPESNDRPIPETRCITISAKVKHILKKTVTIQGLQPSELLQLLADVLSARVDTAAYIDFTKVSIESGADHIFEFLVKVGFVHPSGSSPDAWYDESLQKKLRSVRASIGTVLERVLFCSDDELVLFKKRVYLSSFYKQEFVPLGVWREDIPKLLRDAYSKIKDDLMGTHQLVTRLEKGVDSGTSTIAELDVARSKLKHIELANVAVETKLEAKMEEIWQKKKLMKKK